MLQALSSTASTAAVRPKFMTFVFDKKSGSSSGKSTEKVTLGKSKEKKDAVTPGKPCTVLSTNCYELKSQATTVLEAVQLHLTSYYEILVLKHQGDSSHSWSAFRRHSVLRDSIREHPILPNVLLVESSNSGSKNLYTYQMEKHKTLKQWLNKVAALKKEAADQLSSCIVNGGAKHAKYLKRNGGKKESVSLRGSPEMPRAPSTSSYSHGPCSPVRHRRGSKLPLPTASRKGKSRTLERAGRSGGKVGGLFRRSTDAQIELAPEEIDRMLMLQNHRTTTWTISQTHRSQADKCLPCSSSNGRVNYSERDADGASLPAGSQIHMNQSGPFSQVRDSIEDIIVEEGPGGVIVGDVSDDSDVPSGTFSCTSSRCSSTRSYGRRGRSGSYTSIGDKVITGQEARLSSTQFPMTMECSLQDDDMCSDIVVAENDQRHSGFIRRASEQVMGLIQMRSLRERRRPSRSSEYVRSCHSTSDLDHLVYNKEIIDHLQQPTNRGSLLHQTTPTLPVSVPESDNRSYLTTPTSTATATSPTPSQNSESDNGDDFTLSRFRHVQIRKHKWKQSPRIQSPLQRSPRVHRTESYQQERPGVLTEVGGANGGSTGRSFSVSPTSQIAVDQWSSRSDTPSEVFLNGSAIHGYNRLACTPGHTSSSTLPRIRKGRQRIISEAGGGGKGSPILTKSPKISRLFHRRQTSSVSLGKILDLKPDSKLISSSDHTPSSFTDHPPFMNKLHLFPAKDVAMELSLVDSGLLRRIKPEELKDAAWTKKATKELLAPNVLAMVRAFNQLALLVPTEILAETTPQARAKVIAGYIRIAARCRALHNYNSLKAVLAGLQCTPIYRLNRTWKVVPSRRKKQFDQLCVLMSEDENWRCYRDKIQRHLLNGTPFIPFLGMFLTQIIQMDSFHSIKKSTSSKVKEDELSKSGSEESSVQMQSSMFDHTDIDPVTSKARRRRSASLGEHSFYPRTSPQRDGTESGEDHTPVFTADNSMERNSAGNLVDTGRITPEDPAGNLEMSHASSSNDEQLDDQEEFSFNEIVTSNKLNTSSHSSTESESDGHTHLTPPTTNGIAVPKIEMYSPQVSPSKDFNHLRNGMNLAKSCETDSGFDIASHLDEEVMRTERKQALSLDEIAVGFKRRSMSLESLLKAYKENRLSLFQMEGGLDRMKYDDNYGSYEESDDEVDDDEEEEEEEGRRGKQEDLEEDSLLNSTCSGLSEAFSDLEISCSTINSSFNTSLLQKGDYDDDEEVEEEEAEREVLLNASSSSHVRSDDKQVEPGSILTSSDTEEIKSSTPMPAASKSSTTKVKRTRSQSSKGTLRRNRVNLLRKPKSFANASAVEVDMATGSSEEILIRLQTATLGCGLGVAPRTAVRTVLQDSVPNSERENHKLSLQREVES